MKLTDIILITLALVSIIMAIWYLFGDSPSFEQTILVLILTLSITTLVKVNVLDTKFKFLVKDFKEHIKHN